MKDVKISARRDLKNKIIQEQGVKYDDDNLRDKPLIHGEIKLLECDWVGEKTGMTSEISKLSNTLQKQDLALYN